MAKPPDFRVQAARCRVEADAATLDNVREQHLRAEAAWLKMAKRHERVVDARAARENLAGAADAHDPQQEPT